MSRNCTLLGSIDTIRTGHNILPYWTIYMVNWTHCIAVLDKYMVNMDTLHSILDNIHGRLDSGHTMFNTGQYGHILFLYWTI